MSEFLRLLVSLNGKDVIVIPVSIDFTIAQLKPLLTESFSLQEIEFQVYYKNGRLRPNDTIKALRFKDDDQLDIRFVGVHAEADAPVNQLDSDPKSERIKQLLQKTQDLENKLAARDIKSHLSSLVSKSYTAVYGLIENDDKFQLGVDLLRNIPDVDNAVVLAAWNDLDYTYPSLNQLEDAYQMVLNVTVDTIMRHRSVKPTRYEQRKRVVGDSTGDTVLKIPDGFLLLKECGSVGWDAMMLPMEVETADPPKYRQGLGQAWTYVNSTAIARMTMMAEDEKHEVQCIGLFTNINKLVVLMVDGPHFLQSSDLDFLAKKKPKSPTDGFIALTRLLFASPRQLGLSYSPLDKMIVGETELDVKRVFHVNATRIVARCEYNGREVICKQRMGPGDLNRINAEANALKILAPKEDEIVPNRIPRLVLASGNSLVTEPAGTPLRQLADPEFVRKHLIPIVVAIVEDLRYAALKKRCHGDVHDQNLVVFDSEPFAGLIDYECMIKPGDYLPASTGRRAFISTRRLLQCAQGDQLAAFDHQDDLEAVAYVYLTLRGKITWTDSNTIEDIVAARKLVKDPIFRQILFYAQAPVNFDEVLGYLRCQM